MPRAANKGPSDRRLAEGEAVEVRVAQVWFWEGFFSRRGINLQRHYEPEPLQVTDLDLLAIEIGAALEERRTIGESKTGTSRTASKPLDRIIWLRGLATITGANAAELTHVSRPSRRVRELALGIGVVAQSLEDLSRREERLRIGEIADRGSHGLASALHERDIRAVAAKEPDLDRAYWFLRSDVWFLDPWLALKRSVGLVAFLSRRWTSIEGDPEQRALAWLLAEAVTVVALELVLATGVATRAAGPDLAEYVSDRLAMGPGDRKQMRDLSEAIDRYIAGLLRRAKAPAALAIESMGAFAPAPPDWAGPLAEVVRRFGQRPDVARQLPRYVDLVVHERLVWRREPPDELVRRLGVSDPGAAARFARLVVSFLVGQAHLPAAVAEAFDAAIPAGLPRGGTEHGLRAGHNVGPLLLPLGIEGDRTSPTTSHIEGAGTRSSVAVPVQVLGSIRESIGSPGRVEVRAATPRDGSVSVGSRISIEDRPYRVLAADIARDAGEGAQGPESSDLVMDILAEPEWIANDDPE